MNTHRFLLVALILCSTLSLECIQDQTPIDIRVQHSSLVVFGLSLMKTHDIDILNLFNVTFLVQCILKGQPTHRIIHIVQAGSLLGRHSCQKLNVNQEYIVFLEPFFDGTYRPADFEEIPYNNQVDSLLEKTCGLSRTYPYAESNDTEILWTNRCPSAVSIDCPLDSIDQLPETTTTSDLALLSALFREEQSENLTLAFLDGQHKKSLFSDDDTRTNQAHQIYSMTVFIFIQCLFFCSFLY